MSKMIIPCAIVLIDDNAVDLYLHEQVMRRAGKFEPIWPFSSPSEALDHLASLPFLEPGAHYPILILLDIKMPEMDGFTWLNRFEKLPAAVQVRCHVIMLSSTLQHTDSIRAEANPVVSAFMSKPLTVAGVLEISDGILNSG
jgi:CheY-like chemotaxis protein